MNKRDVIQLIESMPEQATLEDILYLLYTRSQIEAGLADFRAGRTLSHAEVMANIGVWLAEQGKNA